MKTILFLQDHFYCLKIILNEISSFYFWKHTILRASITQTSCRSWLCTKKLVYIFVFQYSSWIDASGLFVLLAFFFMFCDNISFRILLLCICILFVSRFSFTNDGISGMSLRITLDGWEGAGLKKSFQKVYLICYRGFSLQIKKSNVRILKWLCEYQ